MGGIEGVGGNGRDWVGGVKGKDVFGNVVHTHIVENVVLLFLGILGRLVSGVSWAVDTAGRAAQNIFWLVTKLFGD